MEMISKLIEDDARTVRSNRGWLESLLRMGFPGYDNLTDEELLAELGKRRLLDEAPSQGGQRG
jgi:hypothetical protein